MEFEAGPDKEIKQPITTVGVLTRSQRWVVKGGGNGDGGGDEATPGKLRLVLSGPAAGSTVGRNHAGATHTPAQAFLPVKVLVQSKEEVSITLGVELCNDEANPGSYVVPCDARPIIIKTVNLSRGNAIEDAQVATELWAMQQVTPTNTPQHTHPHTHVVHLLAALRDTHRLYLFMPYYDGGDLFDRVQTGNGLSVCEARMYLTHILHGLMELKRHGIAHGDVSLENIMLMRTAGPTGPYRRQTTAPYVSTSTSPPHTPHDTNNTHTTTHNNCASVIEEPMCSAHLIDLGSCVRVGPNGTCPADEYLYRGKLATVAPEVLVGDPCAPVDPFAIDVWALGVCLYAMITGRPLYLEPNEGAFRVLCEGRAHELIGYYAGFGLPAIDPLCRDLLCSMLNPVPHLRPTLVHIAQHPWVNPAGALGE